MVPLHSYKFLATLQHTLAGYAGSPQRNPLLLRVDTNAGHGGGAPPWPAAALVLSVSMFLARLQISGPGPNQTCPCWAVLVSSVPEYI